MSINDLKKYYPSTFYPIFQNDYNESKNIIDYRCSAFPFFFTTFKSLSETLEKINEKEVNEIRWRFLNALEKIQSQKNTYKKINFSNLVEKTTNITIDDVINLTENSGIDLFIPDSKIVLKGHDHHGFILYCDHKNQNVIGEIKSILKKNSLYLLTNPYSNKNS